MSRTLSRPMFKLGGSTSGITSGLDKPKRGRVDEPGSYSHMSDEDLARYAASSQRVADKFFPQQKPDINRFLIDWGLSMVGNPPVETYYRPQLKKHRHQPPDFLKV